MPSGAPALDSTRELSRLRQRPSASPTRLVRSTYAMHRSHTRAGAPMHEQPVRE